MKASFLKVKYLNLLTYYVTEITIFFTLPQRSSEAASVILWFCLMGVRVYVCASAQLKNY